MGDAAKENQRDFLPVLFKNLMRRRRLSLLLLRRFRLFFGRRRRGQRISDEQLTASQRWVDQDYKSDHNCSRT